MAAQPSHQSNACEHCGHAVGEHGARSGLCGAAGCECEGFVGTGLQPWEVSHRRNDERPAWACTWLGETAGAHTMAIVRADDIESAAREGANVLDADLRSGDDPIDVEKIGVAPLAAPITWYGVRWVPEVVLVPKAFQCCGGAATPDGHSGYCPDRSRDA